MIVERTDAYTSKFGYPAHSAHATRRIHGPASREVARVVLRRIKGSGSSTMKTFQCTCAQPLFFHNTKCLACGAEVVYDPTLPDLGALTAVGEGTWALAGDTRQPAPTFRFCDHRADAVLCNWLVPAGAEVTECLSCRLTRTIPDLSRPANPKRLAALESAKRELLYSLLAYGLPIDEKLEGESGGLAFDFLESIPGEPAVLTGHNDGLVTINVAEADSDYREQNREALNEPYRTLLGHFRHEVGHHYWDVLIRDTEWLPRFRELFGDEQADYQAALARHYEAGAPADWQEHFISSYASSHPWEDWAETWAHYMHMRSTLQTAASYGIDISRVRLLITPFERTVLCSYESDKEGRTFLERVNAWVVLTAVLNDTARSMGQPPIYPFVLNNDVVTKLHFIQCVMDEGAAHGRVPPLKRAQPTAPKSPRPRGRAAR